MTPNNFIIIKIIINVGITEKSGESNVGLKVKLVKDFAPLNSAIFYKMAPKGILLRVVSKRGFSRTSFIR